MGRPGATASIRLEPLDAGDIDVAARLLARAFVTNPLHVAAFGPGRLDANEAFFRLGLAAMKGPRLAALEGSRMVGVIHWAASPACRHSGTAKLLAIPRLATGLGLLSTARVLRWLSTWSKFDPDEPHVHLGPIGVDPERQGARVGSQMMERYCQALKRAGLPGHLETDRPENVRFYERFGFEVTATTPVLGVTTYFMRRR